MLLLAFSSAAFIFRSSDHEEALHLSFTRTSNGAHRRLQPSALVHAMCSPLHLQVMVWRRNIYPSNSTVQQAVVLA